MHFVGGGILPSAGSGGGGNAQFGFVFSANNGTFVASGSYNDRYWSGGPVKLTITGALPVPENSDGCLAIATTYKPVGKGQTGFAYIYVCDSGNNGPSNGDWFSIELVGGAYDGYSNEGYITQGNITQTS